MAIWFAWFTTASWRCLVRQPPAETQTLETRFSARVAREVRGGWLIAEWPAVYAPSVATPVMATREALRRDPTALAAVALEHPVYFAGDMYCEPHFGGVDHSACEDFTARFQLETVLVESLNSHQYVLLRLRGLRTP
jgi:hypothetical protein